MPTAESIMLFYRKAFSSLISLQVVLYDNNGNWARVKVKYKRLFFSYTLPLSAIAIIARRTFCFLAYGRICSAAPCGALDF